MTGLVPRKLPDIFRGQSTPDCSHFQIWESLFDCIDPHKEHEQDHGSPSDPATSS